MASLTNKESESYDNQKNGTFGKKNLTTMMTQIIIELEIIAIIQLITETLHIVCII